MGIIQDELQEIRKLCEHIIADSKLIACVESLVRVEIRKTKVKALTVCFQFSKNYPNSLILLELKSKHLSDLLLTKLTQSSEEEATKYIGKPQILKTLSFIEQFLKDYPLICCYDEINEIKKELMTKDEIKISQKSSFIIIKLMESNYYVNSKIFVPNEYPECCVSLELESNFPTVLQRFLIGQSKELSRQCVEPPLNIKKRQDFVVKPSLLRVARLIIKCTRDFVKQICPVCRSSCLPPNPQDLVDDENADSHVERVYCGHLYHLKCLLNYLKTPPFKGGKKCPLCNEKIYHEKWKVADKLAEDRWAHKQARQRELEEVVDFLS